MTKRLSWEWVYAAGIRALKTVAQTALGMFTVGMALNEVNWTYVISVSIVSGIYSILTSIATNLPEVGTDGTLYVDTSNPEKDTYLLAMDEPLNTLIEKKRVKLSVKNNDASPLS